jgi:two-component system, sensor histidine kinase PdtaS
MAAPTPLHPDASLRLALAVVASSSIPLLLLDGEFAVIAASTTFCQTFEIDPSLALGAKIFALGAGEWDAPRLRSLLSATATGYAEIQAYEMDLKRTGRDSRHLVLKAQKLDYGDDDPTRLLLTVADVTDARAAEKLKDDLLREKAILLQEVQHRVANSLQIIASVLMQSARKVPSEEVRSHLHEAHHRVMSIAAVQQQLVASRLGDVELRAYFTQLCQSLGASMIPPDKEISIGVNADESSVNANISVSLGLIVTELVINALKHAYPGRRGGEIKVEFNSHERGWTLAVGDDGVGMPKDAAAAKSGLGTSIVEALAKQLEASIEVTDRNPGTLVSVIRSKETTDDPGREERAEAAI